VWINAQAVYKACYNALATEATNLADLREFYIHKTMTEQKKFRWRKMRSTKVTREEALYMLDRTSLGDHLRSVTNETEKTRKQLETVVHFALQSVKILEDGTCFVGHKVYTVIQPYLNGQERIEDDSRSD
jgi:hypothetical protein